MLTLLVTVILAGVFALFATQNTESVAVDIANSTISAPLYLVVLVPLVLGLAAAYFVHMAYSLSFKLTINEQSDELKKLREENAELAKGSHKLELENTKLEARNGKQLDEESI